MARVPKRRNDLLASDALSESTHFVEMIDLLQGHGFESWLPLGRIHFHHAPEPVVRGDEAWALRAC